MKKTRQILTLALMSVLLILGCSKDNSIISPKKMMQEEFEMVDIKVVLPADSTTDLSNTSVVSLGKTVAVSSETASQIPFNPGSPEIGYLLDGENNILLAGFISDNQKEISIETTAEVMLYFVLDYYLLPDSAKNVFLNNVRQAPEFTNLVNGITTLFVEDNLMYANGAYLSVLKSALDQITAKKGNTHLDDRIFFNDEATKSGVTLSSVDSTNIRLQNSLPRRSRVLIYKKSTTDRNGNVIEIANYMENPLQDFEMEIGKSNTITELEVGSSLSQINAQQASIDNASDTGPILLPVNPATEFVAEYEVVVIGSGLPKENGRNMSEDELAVYEKLTKKTYVLDYFLPTLLDIGGNKAMLPSFGSDMEEAMFNAVLPVLEAYPEVIAQVVNNEFKAASNLFLPALYDDIRLSDDLRNILTDVYSTISGNGEFPNTFIQSQELIETGLPRTKIILRTIDQNIKANNSNANFAGLRTSAFNFESWTVKSIDAVVEMQQERIELCLGEAAEIRATIITDFEPEVEEVEFHWSTSNNFGGRVQDIGSDANNFGVSIVSKSNFVSYISAALDSDLGSGDNLETVTVITYFKNKITGVLTEAGRDSMLVNNKKGCVSFTVPVVRQPNIREITSISCPNRIGYQAFSPVPYRAEFEAVEGAIAYRGKITSSNGVVNAEMELNVGDLGNGLLGVTLGAGGVVTFNSCSEAQAEEKGQEFVDAISVEPVSIEITPIF